MVICNLKKDSGLFSNCIVAGSTDNDFPLDDQCIGLELIAGGVCELVLVRGPIVEPKLRRTVDHRNSEEIRMFLNDIIGELRELRIRFSQGTLTSVLPQACLWRRQIAAHLSMLRIPLVLVV